MFNWLSTVFPRRKGFRPAPHLTAVAAHNALAWPDLSRAEAQSRLYQQSPWVYIAINRIAEAAALVPLHVHPRFSTPLDQPAARHPLEDLLDTPNPYISRFELIEQTIAQLELTGDSYWFLAGDSAGVPVEIWPLRSDRVSIVPDETRYVKGYVYELDGQRIPLLPEEVVHFRRWHPANDYYGLSALEAARLAVSSDRAMAEWNHNTFGKDNGIPAGIVTIKDSVSEADYDRIRQEWRQTYGGPQRRTAFLRGTSIEWHHIGLNHNELDFLKGRQAHRDEILNIFGLPVGLLSENATEANARVAERLFIERTLWPKLVRLAQKITQDMLPFWPGAYVAEFEDIRPTDAHARLDEIKTAYPVLSINEIRQRYYRLPATLWGQLPVGASKQLTGLPESTDAPASGGSSASPRLDSEPAAAAAAAKAADEQPDTFIVGDDDDDDDKRARRELSQWEHFTLRRLGKSSSRAFEVRCLPPELALELSVNLLGAATPAEVQAIFAQARAQLAAAE
ncbi:MAG: phage portal protein [Anaerolineae bacterium]|nr:phage portal protein [Anaerolineae bacterium]